MFVTTSAPGKLMLFGEHAVVYGKPCIATAVDLRMQVSIRLTDTNVLRIKTPLLTEPFITPLDELTKMESLPREVRFVAIATRKFQEYLGTSFSLDINTKSEFSHSYGLGSSSAVTVATVKALSVATDCDIDLSTIFRLSYDTVLEAQKGIGSGFDIAAATYGGTIYYVAGGKIIEPLISEELPLVIGYSGTKASTTEYVRKVAKTRKRFPKLVDFIMDNIEYIVNDAKIALQKGNYEEAGQLMNFNQGYLHALSVSTYELDYLIYAARFNGAYGAKLSGAGGGDCMIALVNKQSRTEVENAIQTSDIPNAELFTVETGAEGVRIE